MICNLKLTVIIVSQNEARVMFHTLLLQRCHSILKEGRVLDRHILVHKFSMCDKSRFSRNYVAVQFIRNTKVGTFIVATIYLQLIQNRYMFRSFTVLQCSHQYCVQPVASDVEVVGYL